MVHLLLDGVINDRYEKTRGCNAIGTQGLLEPEAQTLLEFSLCDHAFFIWLGFISLTADWLPLYAKDWATKSSLVSYLMGSTTESPIQNYQ